MRFVEAYIYDGLGYEKILKTCTYQLKNSIVNLIYMLKNIVYRGIDAYYILFFFSNTTPSRVWVTYFRSVKDAQSGYI